MRESNSGPVRLVHVMTVPQTFAVLDGQTRYMAERGFETTGISSAGPYQATFAAKEGVSLLTVEMPREITPFRDLRSLTQLVKAIRSIRPHLVQAHTPKGGLLGMIASTIARVPVRIYMMHGLPLMTASGVRRALLTLSERTSCWLAHRVIAVSPSLRDYAVEQGLCPAGKIVTLLGGTANGIDSHGMFDPDHPVGDVPARRAAMRARFQIPSDAVVVGFLGRLVRDKGVQELADAWSMLSSQFPSLHLLIAGPWEPQDPVAPATRAALESDRRVHFLGQTSDVRSVYAAADIVTLPTYREGMGLVLLEASSMRLPVVATRIPGCVDAVSDGTTGTLIPLRDHVALQRALATYITSEGLRREHGRAGRERVLREFDRERIWAAIHALYVALLRERVPSLRPSAGTTTVTAQ